jgi:hypothetical protein
VTLLITANDLPSPSGQWVKIGFDSVGVPAGIVAYDHGTIAQVRLDLVQLRAFAERILACAQPSCSRM